MCSKCMYVLPSTKWSVCLPFAYGKEFLVENWKRLFGNMLEKNVKVFSDDAVAGDGMAAWRTEFSIYFLHIYYHILSTQMYINVFKGAGALGCLCSTLCWLGFDYKNSKAFCIDPLFFHLISSSDHSTHACIILFTV